MYREHEKKVSFDIDEIVRGENISVSLNKWDCDIKAAINKDLDDEDCPGTTRGSESLFRYSLAIRFVIIKLLARVTLLRNKLIALSDDDRG